MFVLKLELLKLISIALDKTIRRMIAEVQLSAMPRETLKLEQVNDNVYDLRNVPMCYLTELVAIAEESLAAGLVPANARDFMETLKSQVTKALDRSYSRAA
jgi:hypothetical protein